jgi:hypothetical protein
VAASSSKLKDLIAVHMPESLTGGAVISSRDDLLYQRNPNGFELRASHWRFNFGRVDAWLIGDLMHQGGRTVGEIAAKVTRPKM